MSACEPKQPQQPLLRPSFTQKQTSHKSAKTETQHSFPHTNRALASSSPRLVPLRGQTHRPRLTERDPNGPRKELNMQGYNQRFPISLRSPEKIECCVSKRANVILYVRKATTILPVVRHKILRKEQVGCGTKLWSIGAVAVSFLFFFLVLV